MNQQVALLRFYRAERKLFKVVDHGGTTVTVIARKGRRRFGTFPQTAWKVVQAMEAAERIERKKHAKEFLDEVKTLDEALT